MTVALIEELNPPADFIIDPGPVPVPAPIPPPPAWEDGTICSEVVIIENEDDG